jgi:hypothetical protein
MPKLVEVNVSASIGGGVQIVDFGKVKSDFHLSESERWNVEDVDDPEKFVEKRREAIIKRLEAQAQEEYKWRYEWRDREAGIAEGDADEGDGYG